MNFSVTQNDKELNKNLYTWDEQTKTFSTKEDNLVFSELSYLYVKPGFIDEAYLDLDSSKINKVIFITGYNCTFNTGYNCTFKTGPHCTFKTGSHCIFDTGYNCTFSTDYNCTFDTGSGCIFDTGSYCTFNTGSNCTFDTGSECVVVRRDIFEVIQLEASKKIKLNENKEKGFEYILDFKTIILDGKEIEISNESFENLKKQLK